MRWNFKITLYLFLFFEMAVFTSCYNTKTLLANPDEAIYRIKQPVYCGTFSSFVSYDKNDKITFNDSITRISNHIYDSIIRHDLKKIKYANPDIVYNNDDALQLSLEFLNFVNLAENYQSIKHYQASPVFSKLTEGRDEDYFLFFVPAGYSRSVENLKRLQGEASRRNEQLMISSAMATAITAVLSGGTAFFLFIPKGEKVQPQGSNCHVMVYKKSSNQITFYRRQYSSKNDNMFDALDKTHLKKQVHYSLREFL